MPELPDLEVFAGNLERRFKNKTLEKLDVKYAAKLNVNAKELRQALEGQGLRSVTREGKTLQLHFKNHAILGLHLMLHGELKLLKADDQPKFEILNFYFKGEECLALLDFQKQAVATLNPAKTTVPDALSKEMNYDYLKALLNGKKKQIKAILLDQDLIRGVGNAYADEILWQAKISPFSISDAIPDKEIRVLYRTIRYVLLDAIKQIKKEHPDQLSGEVRDFLIIHNPDKQKSPAGATIQIDKKGGRNTYYTAEQILYKD